MLPDFGILSKGPDRRLGTDDDIRSWERPVVEVDPGHFDDTWRGRFLRLISGGDDEVAP